MRVRFLMYRWTFHECRNSTGYICLAKLVFFRFEHENGLNNTLYQRTREATKTRPSSRGRKILSWFPGRLSNMTRGQ